MSADPTLFINDKYIGPILTDDLSTYMAKHYPGAKYELKDGWRVMVTVTVVQAMEIVEGRKAMSTAYERLVNDLKEANQKAMEAVEANSDGGSANLDSVFLRLKGWRENKVLAAIKEAGLYCRAKRRWVGEGYMITPTIDGMGDKRAKAVTVMCEELTAQGWDVIAFRQMD